MPETSCFPAKLLFTFLNIPDCSQESDPQSGSGIGAYMFEENRDGLKKENEKKKVLSSLWLIWLLSQLGKTNWKQQWCSGAPTKSQKLIVNFSS